MHFCVLATRVQGAFSVPRKYGLNWFIPALVNSSVGSSCGTTGDDGTNVWPCFSMKKSRNCCRICADVSMGGGIILEWVGAGKLTKVKELNRQVRQERQERQGRGD